MVRGLLTRLAVLTLLFGLWPILLSVKVSLTASASALKPDAVSINTWPDTHASYARMALEAGAHVFIEKPLADTVAEAEDIAALAKAIPDDWALALMASQGPRFRKI
jgi:predicted dehydrogenase